MLPRFTHMLVPIDFTQKNRETIDVAFEIGIENRAKVTLLHVIETIDAVSEDPEIDEFYRKLELRAVEELDAVAQRFCDTDVVIEAKVRYGKRAAEIVRYAVDRHVDLIVMGSHSVNVEHPASGWGTVSYQVSLLCQCPILLVK